MLSIILNIVDDDDRAFVEKVYLEYEKQLYAISDQYLGHHQDAQDCVHETVRLIMENIEKLKHARVNGYVERFVTVVCRNCALNMLRVKRRKNAHEQSFFRYNYDEEQYVEIDIPDYSACVDKIYVSEENCEYLHQLINRLDQKYRDVILLKSLGLDNKSIAKIMNITEDLVRQRYLRAKKQLLEMGGEELYVESR